MVTDYKITDTKTNKTAYECMDCSRVAIYPTNTSDGLKCPQCNSNLFMYLGYVIKRRDDDDKKSEI